jgi:hypothetical protein
MCSPSDYCYFIIPFLIVHTQSQWTHTFILSFYIEKPDYGVTEISNYLISSKRQAIQQNKGFALLSVLTRQNAMSYLL